MRKVLHVVSARPNFMKVAPIHRAIARRGNLAQRIVHTGQHYGATMSDVFFADLGMPTPDIRLDVGSGSHAEQTARTMVGLERALDHECPDLLTVVGDTNGAVSAALVAAKADVRIAHVEAGLRSFDRRMPEEVNRVVVDHLADIHLTPSPDANANLMREGIDPQRVRHVGNVMIDTLLVSIDRAQKRPTLQQLGLTRNGYAVCTLHRPSNVDNPTHLLGLLEALSTIARRLPVVFPVHPRARRALDDPRARAVLDRATGLRLVPPAGYLEFLALTSQARLILTDSGGLQEESTVLGVPCLTLRENTERPITVEQGTNLIVGTDPAAITQAAMEVLDGIVKAGRIPDLWDGRAAERIADVYESELGVGAPTPALAVH
jgi:UDP-N-acetylglucosamine 2-epimerase (non-hydrolysing)